MKTQFYKQLELIKQMAIDNITERMSRCDSLEFDDHEFGLPIPGSGHVSHLKKDKDGVTLYDGDIFVNRLTALSIKELCIVSDALN